MNRIILADNQAIFRAGAARVLALEDDMRISSQCEDLPKLASAIESLRGSIVVVSSSLHPDMKELLARTEALDSRLILVTENSEQVADKIALLLDGVLSRNAAGPARWECFLHESRGQRCV